MPAMKRSVFILIGILLLIGFAEAQNSQALVNPRTAAARARDSATYTLTQVSDTSQVLADGTRFQWETVMTRARDSHGRTRLETIAAPAGVGRIHIIFITDPVAGLSYMLRPETHTATRMHLPSTPSRATPPAPLGSIRDATGQRPTFQYDKLGTDVIDGVKVEGRRTTETIPTDYEGNDRPIVTVTERWYSPLFGFPLRTKNSDPRQGDGETRVQDLSLGEPDPTLFQVPADYKIQDVARPGEAKGTATAQNSQNATKQTAGTGPAGVRVVSRTPVYAHVNAPYSVTQVSEHTQTLADGTNIHEEIVTKLARDSRGRTRTEMLNGNTPGVPDARPLHTISILDPVAGVIYRLNADTHTGTRHAIPYPPSAQIQRPGAAKAPDAPSYHVEQLGTQTIDGLIAEGSRSTETIPKGLVGNDRPITAVSENWYARELGLMVASKKSDPQGGNDDMHITDLSLVEPDATLFAVPSDYTIQDQ